MISQPAVPETALKRRKRDEAWAAKKATADAEAAAAGKKNSEEIFKRAEKYVKEYRDQVRLGENAHTSREAHPTRCSRHDATPPCHCCDANGRRNDATNAGFPNTTQATCSSSDGRGRDRPRHPRVSAGAVLSCPPRDGCLGLCGWGAKKNKRRHRARAESCRARRFEGAKPKWHWHVRGRHPRRVKRIATASVSTVC